MTAGDEKEASYAAYMARVGRETIPCYEPQVGERELELVAEVIRSGWLSEHRFTRAFERELARRTGRASGIAFSNATGAIVVGLKALGIGPGCDVVVPSLSHSADPNAVAFVGARPVFADIDPDTLTLSVDTIDAVRTKATRAVLFVAAYGSPSHLDEVADYCERTGLTLINDCAPALFGTYKGRPIPSWGAFSVLSFFADKTITTGEGGMLLTDLPDLVAEVNLYKHDGRRERGVDLIERHGANYRITEMQAAVGVAQLERADGFVARKKRILELYRTGLAAVSPASVFTFAPEGDICPHRVLVFVPDARALIAHLESRGIGARTLFMPMHTQPCYGDGGAFPHTDDVYARGVCLPSAPSLTDAQVAAVCQEIAAFYA